MHYFTNDLYAHIVTESATASVPYVLIFNFFLHLSYRFIGSALLKLPVEFIINWDPIQMITGSTC